MLIDEAGLKLGGLSLLLRLTFLNLGGIGVLVLNIDDF